MKPQPPQRFRLVRDADESGVSGTGHIADGVIFEDGTSVLRWRTLHRSTAIYASPEELMRIHGHNGATRLEGLEPVAVITKPDEPARMSYQHWANMVAQHHRGFALGLIASLPPVLAGPSCESENRFSFGVLFDSFAELFDVEVIARRELNKPRSLHTVTVGSSSADWVNTLGPGSISFEGTRVVASSGIFHVPDLTEFAKTHGDVVTGTSLAPELAVLSEIAEILDGCDYACSTFEPESILLAIREALDQLDQARATVSDLLAREKRYAAEDTEIREILASHGWGEGASIVGAVRAVCESELDRVRGVTKPEQPDPELRDAHTHKTRPDTVEVDVSKCARCEGDHPGLAFHKLLHIHREILTDFDYCGICPKTQQPIFLKFEEL